MEPAVSGTAVTRNSNAAGWHVIAATVSQAKIDQFDGPPDIGLRLLDVTAKQSVQSFFGGLQSLHGLVNCARILVRGEEYDLDVFKKLSM